MSLSRGRLPRKEQNRNKLLDRLSFAELDRLIRMIHSIRVGSPADTEPERRPKGRGPASSPPLPGSATEPRRPGPAAAAALPLGWNWRQFKIHQ